MVEREIIEKVEFTRKAGSVKRFHTMTTLVEDRVAIHTYNVMNLVIALSPNDPSVDLLKSALYHDVTECLIGDIPTNIKQDNPDLDIAFKKIEEGIEKEHGFHFNLMAEEKLVLKIADILEGLWYSIEEVERGNFELKTAVIVYREKLLKFPEIGEVALSIRQHLVQRYEVRIN